MQWEKDATYQAGKKARLAEYGSRLPMTVLTLTPASCMSSHATVKRRFLSDAFLRGAGSEPCRYLLMPSGPSS